MKALARGRTKTQASHFYALPTSFKRIGEWHLHGPGSTLARKAHVRAAWTVLGSRSYVGKSVLQALAGSAEMVNRSEGQTSITSRHILRPMVSVQPDRLAEV